MKLYEPFAGLGAYSLYCLWQAAGSDPRMRAEPPVSRVGNKAGFVRNTFRAFGLVRQTWEQVHLNDLDPVCHLFHLLYASSELRDQVARRLWALVPCPACMPSDVHYALEGKLKPTPATCKGKEGCPTCNGTGVQDARLLWDRIRRDPVPGDVVEACARALFLQSRSFQLKPVSIAGGAWDDKGMKPEHYEQKPGARGNPQGDDSPRWTVAERVESLPGRWVDTGFNPEFRPPNHGGLPRDELASRVEALPGMWVESGYKPEYETYRAKNGDTGLFVGNPRDILASRVSLLPGPGACQIGITRMDALEFARGVQWGKDCVCVLDPPYEGTTGYQASSCRADVIEIARLAHAGGALVILHEGVGMARDLGAGWHERSASPLRARGSTFHAGGVEKEWVTTNRAPVWWPAEQATMFG